MNRSYKEMNSNESICQNGKKIKRSDENFKLQQFGIFLTCSGCYSQKLTVDLLFSGMFWWGKYEFFLKMHRKNFSCEKYGENTF